MTTEERVVYISKDNKPFLNQYACQTYEEELELKEARNKFLTEALMKEFSEIAKRDLSKEIKIEVQKNGVSMYYKYEDGEIEEFDENFPEDLIEEFDELKKVSLIKYGYKIEITIY